MKVSDIQLGEIKSAIIFSSPIQSDIRECAFKGEEGLERWSEHKK